MASIEDIAREVIAGKWGSGASRKENLVNSGYDYSAVQSAVNSMMGNGGGSSSGVSTKNYDSDGGGIDSEISSMENQLFGIENRRKSEAPTYTSKFQSQIDNLNGILESRRNAFNYNAEDDPLYQQYAKDYTRRGQQAMEDTLGKVSARTG